MASCDDDFSLLADDHHHHYSAPPPPPPNTTPTSHRAPIRSENGGGEREREGVSEENDSAAEDYAFCSTAFDSDRIAGEKRKSGGDDLAVTPYGYKKPKPISGERERSISVSVSGERSGEYRKDREEWSDAAIACLLEAYTDKFSQLNRGNLRGRDWEEVAAVVSERCERQSKSVEQCKNKVDNLKKRYKLERQRMITTATTTTAATINGGVGNSSHWPWFKKMEQIVGNSVPVKAVSDDDKAAAGGGGSSATTTPRQSKRYAITAASSAGQIINMKPKSAMSPKWRRVIFKISGGALAGAAPNNVDPKVMMLIAREVAIASRLGVEVAIVVGGRNLFCGDSWVNSTGLERSTAYQIGMMATVMNSVLLQSALEKMGVQTRIQTAFSMQDVAEPYSRQRAIRHLEKGRVVIFAGIGAGAGNPLFTTDTAAALRALEIHAEAVLKGTNVDGVYDCTSQDSNFTFEHISFRDLATRGATLMDTMALTFCEEHRIPVVVFNLLETGNISKALCGEQVGTLIDVNGRIS